jgi:hypothetical protein
MLVVLEACQVNLVVPAGAELSCTNNEQCPAGYVCREAVSRCVAADSLGNVAPPELVGLPVISPLAARAGTELTVTFEVNKALAVPPEVTAELRSRTVRWVHDASASQAPRYVYRHTIQQDHPEGVGQLFADLLDASGNRVKDLLLGTFSVDLHSPELINAHPSAPGLKGGDVLAYTVNVSERLRAPGLPRLTVTQAGNVLEGFFPQQPATRTETSFSWTRTVNGLPDGAYQVELSLVDEVGNESGPLQGEGFTIDGSAPALSALSVEPRRVNAAGNLTVTFDASEAVAAGGVVVTVGDRAMSCGAYQPSPPSYRCTRAMTGSEIPAGTEAAQSVVVTVTDVAGNRAQLVDSATFDFRPPALLSSAATPAAAKAGDLLIYTINVSEVLRAPGRPTLGVKRNGAALVGFFGEPVSQTETSFTWTRSLSGLSDGVYTVEVTLEDAAGNVATAIAATEFSMDVSVPRVSPLLISPARVNASGTIALSFDVDEAVPSTGLAATLGGRRMGCTTFQATSPNYSCSYAMTGSEAAPGEELAQIVLVEATDAAGNRGQASGSVVLDLRAPALVSGSSNPASAKRGDLLVYTVNVSEPLGGRPEVVVKRGGVEQSGFFPVLPASETATSFAWTRVAGVLDDGEYTVEVSFTDVAGNGSGVRSATGFGIDSLSPEPTVLSVAPQRIRGVGLVSVTFNVSEPIPAGKVSATLGARQMGCGAYQAASPHYTCSYAMTGTEVASGVEAPQTVLVSDAAGNRGQATGSVTFDFRTPSLVSSSANPASAKLNDLLIYTVNVSEPLQGWPTLVVKKGGLVQSGFFPAQPLNETSTSFSWTRTVDAADVGSYSVEVSLTDAAGNSSAVLPATGFSIDSLAPQVLGLAVAPSRIRGAGTVTVTFDASEPLPAPGPDVTLGIHAMSCGAAQSASPHYTCSYAMTGTELAAGTEAAQTVLVKLTDAAGNRSEKGGSMTFDFKPPAVGFAAVAYLPGPSNPLSLLQAGGVGTKIVVQLSADEPLDAAVLPAFSAKLDAYVLTFARQSVTSLGATFEVTVPVGAPDGEYVPSVDWTDLAGNRNLAAGFSTPKLKVKASSPALVVNQGEVTYLRSPWGNGATETLGGGGFTLPSGPYYALAPAIPLDPRTTLSASAFALATGPPTLVRIWGDALKQSLMGTVAANADGTWPRRTLANLDAPAIWASGVDEAGNESALVMLDNVEWVATPRAPAFGTSPHQVNQTTFAEPTLATDPSSTLPSSTAVEGADGTAALSRAEMAWREMNPSDSAPVQRSGAAMAYDSARGRVVLFGGSSGNEMEDTWEWDGATWIEKATTGARPPERSGHAMAYDSARGRVVLFGGYGGGYWQDTWEWDGTTWTNKTPAGTKPSGRRGHAMAYDSARGRVVLFGGSNSIRLRDVWEWDGTTWTSKTLVDPRPSARASPAMAYDSARGRVVLFGGDEGSTGTLKQDVWEWDGTSWADRTPAGTKPSARDDHAMAYDSARGRVVLFGGDDGASRQDLWEWDGSAWLNKTPAGTKPNIRKEHAMAYDSARGRLVLFGGIESPPTPGVWEWDGSSWIVKTSGDARPSGRYNHAMAYDSARSRVVLVGGHAGGPLQDVWEWDGVSWGDKTPVGTKPSARLAHALAYDSTRGRTLLFGGREGGSSAIFKQDTWVLNGPLWSDVTPDGTKPTPRWGSVMAHDSARGRTVLFGGYDGSYKQDVWEWDGTAWLDKTPAGLKPSGRHSSAMAYDSARGRIVLFGGYDGVRKQDVWEWDGTSWFDKTPAGTKPVAREDFAMAYDSARGRVVLFGGDAGTTNRQDLWEWDGTSWADKTPAGLKPDTRYGHAMVYDAARDRLVLFAGRDGGGPRSDLWELNAKPTREPAVRMEISLASSGIELGSVSQLRVRARCGGTFFPHGSGNVGAILLGWSSGGLTTAPGQWLPLATNTTGLNAAQPYLPASSAALIDWSSSSTEELRRLMLERDRKLAFQCRPGGSSGIHAQEAAVALDYLELRIRYRP